WLSVAAPMKRELVTVQVVCDWASRGATSLLTFFSARAPSPTISAAVASAPARPRTTGLIIENLLGFPYCGHVKRAGALRVKLRQPETLSMNGGRTSLLGVPAAATLGAAQR